jgi:UDP-N-acetylmuramate: L-alanyl-gamma-D-glutamyl-meso-diaminopimelate ligase
MRIHFIAIGGSAMHNLAIALHLKGYQVSGSDDEIFEPARGRLAKYGLLPKEEGWFPERMLPEPDAIILGMHAKADNPELLFAKERGLKIYSYPEFLYEQSKDKLRVVIGGSHGKTTITAMILHVLKACNVDVDYMVGARLEGYEVMVRLTSEARIMVFEGDEYLTSALDRRPKFHVYMPNIALISGIAWDHMNVFPTFENYIDQFRQFIQLIPQNGTLVYCSEDVILNDLGQSTNQGIEKIAYSFPDYNIQNGITTVNIDGSFYPLSVFGRHNLMNLKGAMEICKKIGIEETDFWLAVGNFKGASNRLELLATNTSTAVYKDFAHAPSKVKATINAMKEQYPARSLVACLELHTYSSLSKAFLPQYNEVMEMADVKIVYFNPHALAIKKLPEIYASDILEAFKSAGLQVFNDSAELQNFLKAQHWEHANLLLMSSGDFDGMNFVEFAAGIVNDRV